MYGQPGAPQDLQSHLQYYLWRLGSRSHHPLFHFHIIQRRKVQIHHLTHHFHRPAYARWVPVHIKDMALLKTMHPEVSVEFSQGHFTVKKTIRSFSPIALDQAHEENKAAIKGDSGTVGIIQSWWPETLDSSWPRDCQDYRVREMSGDQTKHNHLETRHH